MPRKKKNFTFTTPEGIEYEVIFRKPDKRTYDDADGVCYSPDEDKPKIYINPHLTKQSELNTAIHEFCHAFFWDKTESEVSKYANVVSRFLYNYCKWRKQ